MTGTPTTPAPTTTPPTLRIAVWMLAVQAGLIGVLAVYVGWQAATHKAASTGSGVATPLITALCAVVFGILAYSLGGLRGWARGPAIVLEMLLIPIGYYMVTGDLGWVGWPTIAIGVVGAGLLLAPSTRTALGLDR